MPKTRVTLTLDRETLSALRAQVGSRGLSAAVDAAVAVHLSRLKQEAVETIRDLRAATGQPRPLPARRRRARR